MRKHLKKGHFFTLLVIVAMLIMTLSPTQNAMAQSVCGTEYTIRSGDTLSDIAQTCDTSVSALLAANPQIEDADLIYPGTVLDIPSGTIPDTGSASLILQPTSGPAGTTITVTGVNYPANSEIRVGPGVLNTEPVTIHLVQTDARGRFTTQVKIPRSANTGRTRGIMAATQGGGLTLVAEFQVTSEAEARTYTVQSGDTLSGIAAQFNTSVAALLRANPTIEDSRLITPGQVLVLPGTLVVIPDTGRRVYTVEEGDTLSEIAVHFGTTVDELMSVNSQIEDTRLIYPGERLTIPEPVTVIPDTGQPAYIVQSGDTLSGISVQFRTTVDALLEANPQVDDPSLIIPGQRIVIPAR